MSFEQFKINRQFLNALIDMELTEPTTVQQIAIPKIKAGKDLVVIAPTGTGKTVAFLLPIVQKLNYAQGIPRALIIAPTRELVLQIEKVATDLLRYSDLKIISLIGGAGTKEQIASLKEGIDLVVGTPRQFLKIYSSGLLKVKMIKTLVLDEADRLMDMGFMPQFSDIQEVIPLKRQNLLFSATFPEKVKKLSEEFMVAVERVEVAPPARPPDTIDQCIYYLENFKSKLFWLERLINEIEEEALRVLIFCRTKENADRIFKYLERKNKNKVRVIHGNKGQQSRINALESFRKGEIKILVATNISARGIDIQEVSHVFNFDIPKDSGEYTHRIGRTGRAFKKGVSISLCDPTEKIYLDEIEKLIGNKIPVKKLPKDYEMAPYLPGEEKKIAMAIDIQKQLDDPTYRGAFHEPKKRKKRKN